ncbi:hypothetical protein FJT64_004640 [Amphibalanus amphitrite]|uniref:Uncharacterized protein n=1 Tax=Amphibalanus amphitrite TaxID=1232801 RepID=A0A6A4W4P8_AMPAM|nr:hypothetical protein FJT64_004640 [Amphibalanus amphitrite]
MQGQHDALYCSEEAVEIDCDVKRGEFLTVSTAYDETKRLKKEVARLRHAQKKRGYYGVNDQGWFIACGNTQPEKEEQVRLGTYNKFDVLKCQPVPESDEEADVPKKKEEKRRRRIRHKPKEVDNFDELLAEAVKWDAECKKQAHETPAAGHRGAGGGSGRLAGRWTETAIMSAPPSQAELAKRREDVLFSERLGELDALISELEAELSFMQGQHDALYCSEEAVEIDCDVKRGEFLTVSTAYDETKRLKKEVARLRHAQKKRGYYGVNDQGWFIACGNTQPEKEEQVRLGTYNKFDVLKCQPLPESDEEADVPKKKEEKRRRRIRHKPKEVDNFDELLAEAVKWDAECKKQEEAVEIDCDVKRGEFLTVSTAYDETKRLKKEVARLRHAQKKRGYYGVNDQGWFIACGNTQPEKEEQLASTQTAQ